MPKRILFICMYLICIGLSVGCGSKNQEAAQQEEQYVVILTEVEEKRAEEQNLH